MTLQVMRDADCFHLDARDLDGRPSEEVSEPNEEIAEPAEEVTSPNVAPNATITSPAGNMAIETGDGLDFEGSCVDPEGGPVTHFWDFNGSLSSTEASPGWVQFTLSGTYHISYVCSDEAGLVDPTPSKRTITVIDPNLAPTGTITAPVDDVVVEVGDSVTFEGTCVDPEGAFISHFWNFAGGAANSTAQSPGAVRFDTLGSYEITYACSDARGLADPAPPTRTITVVPRNLAPTASITAPSDGARTVVGQGLAFAAACVDSEGGPLTHAWTFGALGVSDVAAPTFVFTAPGTFTVTYTCSDEMGRASEPVSLSVLVVPAGPVPFTLSGNITFERVPVSLDGGLDYAHSVVSPARNIMIELVDPSKPGVVVASAVTDASGHYSVSWGPTGPNRVVVYALARTATPRFEVRDNTRGNAGTSHRCGAHRHLASQLWRALPGRYRGRRHRRVRRVHRRARVGALLPADARAQREPGRSARDGRPPRLQRRVVQWHQRGPQLPEHGLSRQLRAAPE